LGNTARLKASATASEERAFNDRKNSSAAREATSSASVNPGRPMGLRSRPSTSMTSPKVWSILHQRQRLAGLERAPDRAEFVGRGLRPVP